MKISGKNFEKYNSGSTSKNEYPDGSSHRDSNSENKDNKYAASDKESFDAELEESSVLGKEVELYRKLISSIETEAVRQMLDQIHEKNFEKEENVVSMQSRRFHFTWAVAASIALLVLAGWWFVNVPSAQPASLYAANFTPATGLPTTLSYSTDTRFAEGMVSYKLKEYKDARNNWEPLLTANPENDTLNYYVGVSFLAEEMPVQAISHLSKVDQNENSIFAEDASWYLALAYLLNSQEEPARAILNDLCAEGSAYHGQCLKILEELD